MEFFHCYSPSIEFLTIENPQNCLKIIEISCISLKFFDMNSNYKITTSQSVIFNAPNIEHLNLYIGGCVYSENLLVRILFILFIYLFYLFYFVYIIFISILFI